MRVLLFHCKKHRTKIGQLANRPADIKPEKIKEKTQSCLNCVVAFITVEKGDEAKKVSAGIAREINKTCRDVGRKDVVLLPFAHLSNNLASTPVSLEIISAVEDKLKKKLNVFRAHFGSHKELLLDVFGHAGSVRYREF